MLALALALMMVFTLAACGNKTDPAPSGVSATDYGTPHQCPSDMPNSRDGSSDNADDISGVTGEVTVEGEKVIHTTNDGSGNISVM